MESNLEIVRIQDNRALGEYEMFKAKGTAKFNDMKYKEAIKYYDMAANVIYSEGDIDPTRCSYYVTCKSNAAQCCINRLDYKAAIKYATEALAIDASNIKALYRRGISNLEYGRIEEEKDSLKEGHTSIQCFGLNVAAYTDFGTYLKLDPGNLEIRDLYRKAANRLITRFVEVGDVRKISLLVDGGADVNTCYRNGMGPLWVACSGGFVEIVEYLLSKGAKSSLHKFKDDGQDTTPIMAAACGIHTPDTNANHVKVLEVLIANGADINAKNKHGIGPLSFSACSGYLDRCDLLISKGADVNGICKGISPLFIAILNNQLETIKLLLTRGANIRDKDINGNTALMLASKKGLKEIAKYLSFWHHCMAVIVFRELGRESALLYSLFDYHLMSILSYI